MSDEELGDLECEACGWSGHVTEVDEQEYDSSGLTWWCPGCGAQWTDS